MAVCNRKHHSRHRTATERNQHRHRIQGANHATDKASRKLKDAIANAKGNPAKDPILYSYANTLYVTWEEVREKAFLTEEKQQVL